MQSRDSRWIKIRTSHIPISSRNTYIVTAVFRKVSYNRTTWIFQSLPKQRFFCQASLWSLMELDTEHNGSWFWTEWTINDPLINVRMNYHKKQFLVFDSAKKSVHQFNKMCYVENWRKKVFHASTIIQHWRVRCSLLDHKLFRFF